MTGWTQPVTLWIVHPGQQEPNPTIPATIAAPPARRGHGMLIALIATAAVAAAGIATTVTLLVAGTKSPAPAKADPKTLAIIACENSLLNTLKSPSTAKFSGESAFITGDLWIVTGNVDAQNGFGAMLRSSWSCSAKGSPLSANAHLTND